MGKIFLAIYHYFEKRRAAFVLFSLLSFFAFLFTASRIRLEEDIAKILPQDKKTDQLASIFQQSRFADKLVITLSQNENATEDPALILSCADTLAALINERLAAYVSKLEYKTSDSLLQSLLGTISNHLPSFLTTSDYSSLEKSLYPDSIKAALLHDIRMLSTPAGIALKNLINTDPLGISFRPLLRLTQMQVDENFILYDNAVMTRDHQHLLLFLTPAFPPNNTGKNAELLNELDKIIRDEIPAKFKEIQIDYFGATAVSAGNARQLRQDSYITLGIVILFLLIFITWYFRQRRAPLLILIPVVYGAAFSLACIYLLKGSISVIAMGTGSLILGVAISYSLHIYNHYLHTKTIESVIVDLSFPLTIGSLTTIGGFLCLEFVKSEMLKDLGLFAAFSLIGAAFCSLVILPHLLQTRDAQAKKGLAYAWVEKLSSWTPEKKPILVFVIIAITIFLSFQAGKVGFESDLTSMNYMSPRLKSSESNLNRINENSLRSVFLVAEGQNLDQALARMEKIEPVIDSLKTMKLIIKSSGPTSILMSDSLQRKRIEDWKLFWTSTRKKELIDELKAVGKELHFKADAFDNFANYLQKDFQPVGQQELAEVKQNMLGDYISSRKGLTEVVSLLRVAPENKDAIYKAFGNFPDISILDRQYLANQFVNIINADFTRIALFASIMVFSVLLLTYGRIELTMVSFIPMFIAWIWILGIMALAGIKFNIINIILSALIFGLGDDYSLFIMDGLLQEYKTGKKNLSSFKSSIILSAIMMLAGLGVLIFARHPALRSIAIISIIGMLCVVFIAQTLIPFFFSLLITNRVKGKKFPWTLFGYSKSIFSYVYFAFGALLLTIAGSFLIRLNLFNKEKGKLIYHRFLSAYAWSVMYIMGNVKKKVLNPHAEDFSKPCVLICNHSSFLDILLTAMLNPKLILLTNKWVWKSPVFGEVVKLADYYPVQQGIENSIDLLKDRIDHGYSIVVFPEGTRSQNGVIRRFHKGAFFLAEKLSLDILPIMIHGSGYGITKGDFLLKDAYITLKFLPRIRPDDLLYGDGYTARAKGIGRYFRSEFERFRIQQEQPKFFREQLLYNYIYKGPILEWYCRIKLRLEKNYVTFHQIVPLQGHLLDLGCGYGFMAYMLRFAGRGRIITAVDYDEGKIAVAKNCFSWDPGIDFVCSDITTFPMGRYDTIILSDTLHYLIPQDQENLIRSCIDHLSENGLLIIREGNKDIGIRHRKTALSEFFSTRLTGFNKISKEGLNFLSGSTIENIARIKNLHCRTMPDSSITSNTIFILSKEKQLVHDGI